VQYWNSHVVQSAILAPGKLMQYETLRLFLHLSRTLHFGQTSRECHLSPSALSRAIQRLEDEVGQALFIRDNRSVAMTPQGRRFQSFANDALQAWDDVLEELNRDEDVLAGKISVFATVTACQSFLPSLLNRFREAYPEIHLQLETGYATDALDMLDRGVVDIAVAALPARVPRHLVTRVITRTPLVFVAPTASCDASRAVDSHAVDWNTLPVVLPSLGLARQAVDRWFRSRRVKPAVYSEVAGSEAILALVSTGCGVGVVPELVVQRSPLKPEVRVVEVEPALGEFRVGVCTERKALHNPLVAAFWRCIDE